MYRLILVVAILLLPMALSVMPFIKEDVLDTLINRRIDEGVRKAEEIAVSQRECGDPSECGPCAF